MSRRVTAPAARKEARRAGGHEKGRAGSPRAGCLPLAELNVLLSRHVFTLSRTNKLISERSTTRPRLIVNAATSTLPRPRERIAILGLEAWRGLSCYRTRGGGLDDC